MSEKQGDKFFDGMSKITQTLDNIEFKQGVREAKAVARSTIAEYIRANEKSTHDYGVFCGAVEWLATAVGLKQEQEVY